MKLLARHEKPHVFATLGFSRRVRCYQENINKSLYLNMVDEKNPKEASQLFYNIIKASVSPKATGAVEKKDKLKAKPKPKSK